jgi:hypothetical protein
MDTKDAGRIGGKRRAAKMTPKQRSEAARKAVSARWAKAKKRKPKSPNPNADVMEYLRAVKIDIDPALGRPRR